MALTRGRTRVDFMKTYLATYIVKFTRTLDGEDTPSEGVRLTPEDAIQQLRNELQECCDAGHIAGDFEILHRMEH